MPTPPVTKQEETTITKYRQKVEEFASDGVIDDIESYILNDLQKKLGLTDEQACAVQEEVLEPLKIYKQQFTKKVAEQGYPLGEKAEAELKKLQNYYEIKDEFVNLLKQEGEQQEAEKLRQQQQAQKLQRQREQQEAQRQQEAEKLRQQEAEKRRQQEQVEAQRLQRQREQNEAQRLQQQKQKTNDLLSEKGVDYTKLRDLLAAGKWKDADQETLAVMLKAAGREEEGYLDYNSIENFPCTDLRTIDQLWVKYSNGRFGFSVQKRIWESVGKDYNKFGDRVGWLKYEKVVIEKWFGLKQQETNEARWLQLDDLTYNLSASEGHLPFFARRNALKWGEDEDWVRFFLVGLCGFCFELGGSGSSGSSRLVNCNI
ncbi:MAG: GUN4 domain-containing protein [Spirirestis rafaelensis WJT71-NPBG6]|nr:GUN4 domain-containing protein [Spirirestis rafaelensis WJT71-NPBG6]